MTGVATPRFLKMLAEMANNIQKIAVENKKYPKMFKNVQK